MRRKPHKGHDKDKDKERTKKMNCYINNDEEVVNLGRVATLTTLVTIALAVMAVVANISPTTRKGQGQ